MYYIFLRVKFDIKYTFYDVIFDFFYIVFKFICMNFIVKLYVCIFYSMVLLLQNFRVYFQ